MVLGSGGGTRNSLFGVLRPNDPAVPREGKSFLGEPLSFGSRGLAFPVMMVIAPKNTLTTIKKMETAAGMSENSIEEPTKGSSTGFPKVTSCTSRAPMYPARNRTVDTA